MDTAETYRQTLAGLIAAQGDLLADATPSETLRPTPGGPSLDVQSGLGPFEDVLGEGGMGVVRTAKQRALHRTVAVKSLKADEPHPAAIRHLLHEAIVAAILDHPNILPIHDIVVDDRGMPHILMKRVEGRPWSDWAFDRRAIRQELGVRDPLVWNLGVFIQVCNAVAYAHDRGILHRDLKLDNVMIGAFGEVLVLDWGIAVALDDRYGERLPLARDQRTLAGTPSMMAPELALAHGERQGPATDVYLLGAMLYHLLAGHPPHAGDSVAQVLASIPQARPRLGDRVPGALARIVDRAMAFEPADRFASATALRDEVRAFLEHRASVRIAHEGTESLDALLRAIESPSADRATLHRHFDQARFAFQQALAEWADNPLATEGLKRARIELARWELAHDEPGAAATLIEPLPDPPTDLTDAIAASVQRQRDRHLELASLQAQNDPSIGRRTRLVVFFLVSLTWIAAPILYGLYQPIEQWWIVLSSSLVPLSLVLLLGIWARDSLSRTSLNRSSWLTMMLIPIAQLTLDAMLMMQGIGPETSLQLRPAIWATVAMLYAALVLPRTIPAAVLFVLLALTAPLWPEGLPLTATIANVALVGMLLWIWWEREPR